MTGGVGPGPRQGRPRTAPTAPPPAARGTLADVPPVWAIVGPAGSGKTTLLVKLLGLWRAAGLRVGAVKHAHHPLRAGDPASDSERLRAAGAVASLAAAAGVPWWEAVLRVRRAAGPLDLIVCEGYHGAPVPQVLVLADEAALETELGRCAGRVRAVVVPAPEAGSGRRARDEVGGLAEFIAATIALPARGRDACAGGMEGAPPEAVAGMPE